MRFAADAAGKKKYQDHLDMHFRQNRDANQVNGRGHSRLWFVGIDVGLFSSSFCLGMLLTSCRQDWLNDGTVDGKGKRRAGGSRTSAKVMAAEEAAQRDAELRSMTVVVPPSSAARVPEAKSSAVTVPATARSKCVCASINPGNSSLPRTSIT